MKSFTTIILIIICLTISGNIHAQSVSTQAKIEINLADVLSIEPESEAQNGLIAFNYLNVQDYHTTQSIKIPNSLVITSAKNINITVQSNGANFVGINSSAVIPVNLLTIQPVFNGTMTGTGHSISLSDQPQILIQNALLGSKKSVTINYEISATNSSSSGFLGKPADSYTQTIIYTATAI